MPSHTSLYQEYTILKKKGQEKGKRQVTGLACVLPVADLSPLLAYHALFCFVFKKKEALETSRLACWQPGWAAGSHQVARGSAQLLLGIEYVHTCSWKVTPPFCVSLSLGLRPTPVPELTVFLRH